MFLRPCTLRALLPAVSKLSITMTQAAGLQHFAPPPKFPDIEYPERRKLKVMEKVPQYPPAMRPFKMQKRLRYMRGPEPLHTELIYKQYGVIAQGGGRLRHGHFEMIRLTLGRNIDVNRMFGVWRVDAPWQPISRKGQGQRMGGGKAAIDHYATPIKANRVIIEVGGECEFAEVKRVLEEIAAKLPFKAIATSYEEMQRLKAREKWLEENNANPWTMKYIIENNLCGVHRWISPKDKMWFGKYR